MTPPDSPSPCAASARPASSSPPSASAATTSAVPARTPRRSRARVEVLDAAIDAGVTFLDTADMYGGEPGLSETLMGEALQGRRDRVVLATKFGHPGRDMGYRDHGGQDARGRTSASRSRRLSRRLQTDWIDLYQLHVPDAATPIDETISVLDDLVREGKIRYYGHSNLAGWQIAEADFAAPSRGEPLHLRAEPLQPARAGGGARGAAGRRAVRARLLPLLPPAQRPADRQVHARAAVPEGSRIMMQRRHVWQDAPWDALEAFQAFCDERGITMLEATFGWLLSRPALSSVIAGATSADQVRANAAAAAAWTPSAADLAGDRRALPAASTTPPVGYEARRSRSL